MQTIILALTLVTSSLHAWGSVGHRVTGKLGMKYASSTTKSELRSIIPDMNNGDLGRASTWADEIKRAPGYAWSKPLHYVDSKDNPPHDCNFDQARDCPDGKCITSAVANFTEQLSCSNDGEQRAEAVKFITHFLGDLTQPLHTCDRLVGGNKAFGRFGNRRSGVQLHSIWDSLMIEKRLKDFRKSEDEFVAYLKNKYPAKKGWTSCLDGQKEPLDCMVEWTNDSNGLNCEIVWKLYDEDPEADLGAEYYEAAVPVFEEQLAKAGVRMAKWFDKYLPKC